MNFVLRVFIFTLGLSLVCGLNLNRCSNGPSSWCKNYLTAKHCDQYKFCKEVVWAQPVQDDEICTLCKDAIQGVGQYLSQNGTKQKIEAALTQLCKDVPISELSQECLQVISEDFDNLYDEIVVLVENGDLVCGLLGLCKTSASERVILDHLINKMPALIKEAMDKNQLPVAAPVLIMDHKEDCSDCEKFVKDIQAAIKNNAGMVDEWKQMVKTECDALGPGLSEICYDHTQDAIDSIIHDTLSSDDAMSICNAIKMCGFSSVKNTDDPCTDCKNFFTDFENMMKQNNSIVDEFNQEILDACQSAGPFVTVNDFVNAMANFYCLQKPEFLRPQCTRYVSMVLRICLNRMLLNCQTVAKKALPKLWQLIAGTTPDEICQMIDFCDSALEIKTKQLVATGINLFTSGEPCKDCTTFMTDLQGVAKNNQSIIDDLTDLVKEQCDQLGPGLSELCKTQVATAAPNLIAQFKVADVGTICTTILMCSSPPTDPPKGGDLCNDCVAFTEDWQSIIKNNKSIIDNLLDKAAETYCKQLPFFLQSECDKVAISHINQILAAVEANCATFVKDYLPYLWNLISENDAQTICSTVYMCGAAQEVQEEAPVEEVITSSVKKGGMAADGEACELCKIVVTEADHLLEENSTEADVIAALEKVCGLLSADIRDECKMFVKQYGPEVVDLLINELSPADICAKIQLCTSRMVASVQAPVTCELCETVAEALDDLLEKSSTEQEIVAAVEKVCSILPSQYRSECDTLVQQYGASIVELLVQLVDPSQLCSKLGLCSSLTNLAANDPCKDCTTFMTDLQGVAMNNQSIIDDLTDLVKEQCDQLGPGLSEICKTQVATAAPNLIAQFKVADVGTICTTILMCSSPPTDPPKGGNLCNDCVAFTEDWQSIIKNNQSVIDELNSMIASECSMLGSDFEKLDNFLDQAAEAYCKQLPEFLQNKCDEIAAGQINRLLAAVEANDAQTICSTLYMCDALHTPKAHEEPVKEKASIPCDACEAVAKALDGILEKNSTEQEIIKELDTVCTIVPSQYQDFCDDIIAEYSDDIVKYLVNAESPQQLCAALGLCSAKTFRSVSRVSDPISCAICRIVIHELDKLIEGNRTEAAILHALDEVCSIVPAGYKEECQSFINKYGKDVVDMLINEVESGVICKELFLCSAPPPITKSQDSITCELCETVATALDDMLKKNSTEEEIIAAVEKVCSILPSQYRTDCDALVQQYGKEIIQLLINELSPQEICSAIKLCTSVSVPVKDSTACELCETVVAALDDMLKKNSTEEEIIEAVEKVCSILPSQYRTECDALVQQYGDMIIQLLINQLSPKDLCSAIQLCTSVSVPVKDSVSCELCETVAAALDDMLKKNSTEEEIKAAVEKVCSILPSQYRTECDALVQQYGDMIIQLLISKLSPKEICSAIKLCTSVSVPVKSAETCDLCVVIATELDNLLSENSTEAEIISTVEKICTVLPSQYSGMCKLLIDEYGPKMIDALINKVSPNKLCSTIGLCSSQTVLKSAETCDLCVVIATELDNLLSENSTEAEIISTVEKICTVLPSQYSGVCKLLIDEYGPKMIDALINKVSPNKLCSTIGLCSSQTVLKKLQKFTPSHDSCLLCEVILADLEILLTDGKDEVAVIKAVEKVCSVLPQQLQIACKNFIDQNGFQLIQFVVELGAPQLVCYKLKACNYLMSEKTKEKFTPSRGTCLICELVLADLEILLSDGKDEVAVINAIEKVCSVFPQQLQAGCKNFIDENGFQLIQFVVELAAPQLVCYKLKVCNYLEQTTSLQSASIGMCPLCELVAGELDQLLTTNSTQAEFEAALDKVCSLLPGSLSSQCDDFIKSVGPAVLAILAQEVEPSKICPALKLCPKALQASDLCEGCKFVIGLLGHALESNATRAEIEKELETVCDQAPSALKETCDELVKQYTPEILDLADHIFDPSYVCLHLGLCKTAAKKPLIGTHPCTYGPSYWCRDEKTAAECHATEHCRLHVWN